MPLSMFKAVRESSLAWIFLFPIYPVLRHLLCDFDTSGGSEGLLDVTVDSELTGLEVKVSEMLWGNSIQDNLR